MNKKIFKSLFMGALLVGSVGTLTSCSKDYDDDINSLKDQITKLETLSTTVTTLQTAVTTAQSTANEALTAAKAAATKAELTNAVNDFNTALAGKADKTALDAAVATLTSLGTDVSALKTALAAYPSAADIKAAMEKTDANAAAIALLETRMTAVEALSSKVAELTKQVDTLKTDVAAVKLDVATANEKIGNLETKYEALNSIVTGLLGQVSKMVTDVDLWTGDDYDGNDLVFRAYKEKATTFGPNGEVVFTQDKVGSTMDSLIVRISPTTANITKDSISLMNSNNDELTGKYLDIVSCEPYTKLLTDTYYKTSANGLWKIKFQVKSDIDYAAFLKAITTKETEESFEKVKFCVAVKSGLTGEDRRVVSAYNIKVWAGEATAANTLAYNVDDNEIANLHNRYTLCDDGTSTANVKELVWKAGADITANITKASVNDKEQTTKADNRQAKPILGAVLNTNITVKFTKPVRAFYVTLDGANALESAPSELNAWESYTYTNVFKNGKGGTVFENTDKGTIQINSANAKGDIIGFRVYAVNDDGTLMDPDGRAFYVSVGDPSTMCTYKGSVDSVGLSTDVETKVSTVTGAYSAKMASGDLSNLANATKVTVTADDANATAAYPDLMAYDVKGVLLGTLPFGGNAFTNTACTCDYASKITAIRIGTISPMAFKEGKTYKYTYTYTNNNNNVIRVIYVEFTKSDLTKDTKRAEKFTYNPKDKQIIEGVFNAYMTPNVYANAATGSIHMNNAFDGLWTNANPSKLMDANYKFTFTNGANSMFATSDYAMTLPTAKVDNKTEYATTVAYLYNGYKYDGSVAAVTIDSFKTIFSCIFDSSVNTFDWIAKVGDKDFDANWVTYAATDKTLPVADVQSTNTANGKLYSVTLDKLLGETNFTTAVYGVLTYVDAHVYTNAGEVKDQYFTASIVDGNIVFKPVISDAQSNPKADVASTLVINCKDSFGHAVKISLKFTVKKQ